MSENTSRVPDDESTKADSGPSTVDEALVSRGLHALCEPEQRAEVERLHEAGAFGHAEEAVLRRAGWLRG